MRSLSLVAGPARWAFPSPKRLLAAIGPGYVVAVGYMDPGNWATDIAAGAAHGFLLLSVILLAGLVGIFLQSLVVRLTLATGRDFASLIRQRLPRAAWIPVWGAAEIALVATDVAELLGSAIAFNLLFGLPLEFGVVLAGLVGFALLAGGTAKRPFEAVVAALVVVVALAFAWEVVLANPAPLAILDGFVPRGSILTDPEMLYLSLGILGATVMPHNLFLHSGLAAERARSLPALPAAKLARWMTRDVGLALVLAAAVNAAILIVAACAFGGADVAEAQASPGIEDAHRLLGASLGPVAALLFALALLAAGLSSTTTGALSGQMVMEGFLGLRLPLWVRAAVTRAFALVPAIAAPLVFGAEAGDRLLVLSQVILGLTLPFILVPLLILLADRKLNATLPLSSFGLRAAGVTIVAVSLLSASLAAQAVA